jgi:hypothetical protein
MSRLLPCSLAVATVLLAACAGPQIAGVEPVDGTISGQCHTDMVRGAVGLAASDATIQRARVDSDSTGVQVVRGPDMRTGGAGSPVETTTGGSRLTIETGRNNAITGMSCS